MDPIHQQQMVVLRLPEELAARVKHLSRVSTDSENGEEAVSFSIRPSEGGQNDFVFSFEGKDYPAMLVNIPTPVEALKTYDNKSFMKSGDIGQLLRVFTRDEDRDAERSKLMTVPGDQYHPNGLTDPTIDIVQRRFEAARINESFLNFRYQEIVADVLDFAVRSGQSLSSISKSNNEAKRPKRASKIQKADNAEDDEPENAPYYEVIEEEVLDFEEFMLDHSNPGQGRVIVFEGSNWTPEQMQLVADHPSILLTKAEAEDDRLEELVQDQRKRQKQRQAEEDKSLCEETVEASNATGGLTLSLSLRRSVADGELELESGGDLPANNQPSIRLEGSRPTEASNLLAAMGDLDSDDDSDEVVEETEQVDTHEDAAEEDWMDDL